MIKRMKKPISWLLTLVMLFSMAMPTWAVDIDADSFVDTTAVVEVAADIADPAEPLGDEIDTTDTAPTDITEVAAPVWPTSDFYTVTYDTITITQFPAISSDAESFGAHVAYLVAESTADYATKAWSYKTNTTIAQVLKNLKPDTEYKIKAVYRVGNGSSSDKYSEGSEIKIKTAADPGNIKIKVRVVGCTEPTEAPSISATSADYKGAKYQTWYPTTEQEFDIYNSETGKYRTHQEALQTAFTALGWEDVPANATNLELTAPEKFGGHKLGYKTWGKSTWYYTLLDSDGNYKSSNSAFNSTGEFMHEGETLVFHYVFDSYNEVSNTASAESVLRNYLKAEDSVSGGDDTTGSDVNVTVRVIGAANVVPEFTLDESGKATAVDYKGGGYQNWLASTNVKIKAADFTEGYNEAQQSKLKYAVDKALKDAGFTDYKLASASQCYVVAPADFGGHKLQAGTKGLINRCSYWYITVMNGTEQKYEGTGWDSYTPAEGDKIIYHYVYNKNYELSITDSETAVKQNYLKVADLSLADVAKVKDVIAKIEAIGRVTKDSEAAINAADQAYEALSSDAKAGVTNYATLTAAKAKLAEIKAATQTKLAAPTIALDTAETNVLKLTIAASSEEAAAKIVTCYSEDKSTWTDWKETTTISGLKSSTKYYIKARYLADDVVSYEDSAESAIFEASTLGATTVTVDNLTDLKKEMESAVVGSEKIVKLGADITVPKPWVTEKRECLKVPAGAALVLDGQGHTLTVTSLSWAAGIDVFANATFTLKDIVIANVRVNDEGLMPTNNWANMVRFMGDNATVNLDGAVIYNQGGNGLVRNGNSFGAGTYYQNATLNIYSGMLYSIGKESYNNAINLLDNGTVNIIPKGDIMIEGAISGVTAINVTKANEIKSAMTLADMKSEYTAVDSTTLANLNKGGTLDYKSGVRIFTSDKTLASFAAPVVAAAGSTGADTADITYTVGDNKVVFTVKNRDTAHGTLMFKGTGYWITSSDVTETGAYALGNTYTFGNLTKDTEYTFNIKTVSLHPEYKDAETEVKVTTTFTAEKLTAPTLSADATKTASSITLTAPDASSEDTSATVEYRKSADGTTWGDWQTSPEFTGLTAGKTYHFQARYVAGSKYWANSDPSTSVQLDTKGNKLTAPVLAQTATKTQNSITLTAPANSTEDTAATVQYRKSSDGSIWGVWQASSEFTGLTAGTTYYFQAKYVSGSGTWLDSAESNTVIVATEIATGAATISLVPTYPTGKTTIEAGSTFDVAVKISNNPGIIGMKLRIAYDSDVLELDNAVDGKLLPNGVFTNEYTANPYVLTWRDSLATTNYTTNGLLATLTFKVKTTVADGSMTNICVINPDIIDKDTNEVTFSFADANVSLSNYAATVAPLTPTISGNLSATKVSYEQNATATALSVTASTTDKGVLSYQWQKSSNGTTWTDISGETAASYTPVTTALGTLYYRCVVTNSLNGQTATATSNAAQIEVTEPIDPNAVSVYVSYSNKGTLVSGKDSTLLWRVAMNVSDLDKDGTVTVNDAFLTLHDKYYTGGKDGYGTAKSGAYTMINKFWGDNTTWISYVVNSAYPASGATSPLSAGDVVDVYIWADQTSGYADLYTWFENGNYSATAGDEVTFTVNGANIMYSDNTVTAAAYPVGATVSVLDSQGQKVSGYDDVKVDTNGQFKLEFTTAGTYTVHIDGTCDYTMSAGYASGQSKTNAVVVPCRATVTVTAAGSSGGGGGGGGGGSSTKKDDTKTDSKTDVVTPEDTKGNSTGDMSFSDVKSGTWYYDAIKTVYAKGLMNGESEKQFMPNNKLSRAMLVTILYRLASEPQVNAEAAFVDVAAGQWYSAAVAWANSKDIVGGVGDGKFAPADSITRQELAAMLYRYAVALGVNTSATASLDGFSDSEAVADWAVEAIKWAVGAGLIKGNDDGTINPNGTATRAEVATVIVRFAELLSK